MKNRFTQKIVGECGIVVIANILNNDKIFEDFKYHTTGTNSMEQRRIIEHYSNYSFRGVYEVRKASKIYTPVFEIDEDYSDNEEEINNSHYCLFLAGLKSKGRKGHAIMVVKENHNKTLTILDPLKEDCELVNQKDFFDRYDCVSLDMVVTKDDGSMQFFYEKSLNHLWK